MRLAFGLGNLAAGRDETRAALADRAPEIARLAGRAARDFVDDANDEAAEQLSIRLVRLAANAAITPEVGVAVATHQAVAILPEALDAALRRDCEELALHGVSCVTNLSYYALEGRARGLFADLDAICVSLLAVTVHANHEAVSEAARAFGDEKPPFTTRDANIRKAQKGNLASQSPSSSSKDDDEEIHDAINTTKIIRLREDLYGARSSFSPRLIDRTAAERAVAYVQKQRATIPKSDVNTLGGYSPPDA